MLDSKIGGTKQVSRSQRFPAVYDYKMGGDDIHNNSDSSHLRILMKCLILK